MRELEHERQFPGGGGGGGLAVHQTKWSIDTKHHNPLKTALVDIAAHTMLPVDALAINPLERSEIPALLCHAAWVHIIIIVDLGQALPCQLTSMADA